MVTKVLSQMSREEIIAGAAEVLFKLWYKKLDVFTYRVLVTEEVIVDCLNDLMSNTVRDEVRHPLWALAFVDSAATHFRLPIWWDNDRVSVNGCHVDFEEFKGDAQRAKLWATLKALNLHAN